MKIVVTISDDAGKEQQAITLDCEGCRWWAHEHDAKPIPLGGGRRLIGFDLRPFYDFVDERPAREIEAANVPKVRRKL